MKRRKDFNRRYKTHGQPSKSGFTVGNALVLMMCFSVVVSTGVFVKTIILASSEQGYAEQQQNNNVGVPSQQQVQQQNLRVNGEGPDGAQVGSLVKEGARGKQDETKSAPDHLDEMKALIQQLENERDRINEENNMIREKLQENQLAPANSKSEQQFQEKSQPRQNAIGRPNVQPRPQTGQQQPHIHNEPLTRSRQLNPIEEKALWSEARTDSCGTIFGNGFTEKHEYCKEATPQDGSLTCYWNARVQSAVCQAKNIRVDPDKIKVSPGGEPIEAVLGRAEDAEFAQYARGAFAARCRRTAPGLDKGRLPFHLHKMMSAFEATGDAPAGCPGGRVQDRPALFVTRYEYANLYHTMTDWYNAWQTRAAAGLPREVTTVFFDGHSAGAMDAGWPALFGGDVRYAKRLGGPTCFREAWFVPAGYLGALAVKSMQPATQTCGRTKWLENFAQAFAGGLGVAVPVPAPPRPQVVVVFRRDYRAHPRVKKAAARKVKNEDQVLSAIRRQSPDADVEPAYFETLSLAEQVALTARADVLVSVHGAGLSHALFMDPGRAALVELFPPTYNQRRHFEYFAKYAGIGHREVNFQAGGNTDYAVPADKVAAEVAAALRQAGRRA